MSTGHHDALFYDDTDHLYALVLTALGQQAEADDLLVLACRPHHNEALAAAVATMLPRLAPPLRLRRPDLRTRPATALAAQHRLGRAPGRRPDSRIWLVAEPDPGTTGRTHANATRFEAARTIVPTPPSLTTMCAYPTADTPAALRDSVLETHPRLITGTGPAANASFGDPSSVLAALTRHERLPEPTGLPVLRVTGPFTLDGVRGIRARVTAALNELPTLVRTDFVAAVNEALTNAFLHGAPPVEVAVWITADHVECRVTDRGPGFSDPLAGYRTEPDGRRTRIGLWLARQTVDDLETWRAGDRFTVRLATSTGPERVLNTHGAVARAETARARAGLLHERLTRIQR